MSKTIVSTQDVAAPTNPFSLATKANGFVFISGQVGKDRSGNIVEGFPQQVTQALENMRAIVEAAGCTMQDIVRVTIYVLDIRRPNYCSFGDRSAIALRTLSICFTMACSAAGASRCVIAFVIFL